MSNKTMYIMAKSGDANIYYSATDFRQLIGCVWPPEGVLKSSEAFTDLNVIPRGVGANMSVDVQPGAAIINCDAITNGGQYFSREDSTVNVTVPSAPGTGTLTHLVVLQVRDPQNNSAFTTYDSGIRVVAGTNTNGAAPALPSDALLLATLTVPAGTASITAARISDARCIAALPGQLLGQSLAPGNTATSDSYVEVPAGSNLTVRVSEPSRVRIEYGMQGHSETNANAVQASIRRVTGTSNPGVGGTVLHSVRQAIGSGNEASLGGVWVDNVSAGTYTYGTTFMSRGATGHRNGDAGPGYLNAYYVGPA